MAGQSILKEYLLALGFKIDAQQAKRWTSTISSVEKGAKLAGAAVATMAGTIATFAQLYASSMEKLYYSSRRSGSTVKQIQALRYAGEQVGIGADQMQGAIEGMARALRGNPGLAGMLKSMGVKVEGRTSAQIMLDAVEAFRKMPFAQGKAFAQMFGLDDDTFLTLAQNLDLIRESAANWQQLQDQAGVDADANAKAMHEWQNAIRDVKAEFVTLEGVVAKALIGPMREALGVTHQVLEDISRIIANKNHEGDQVGTKLAEALGFKTRDVVQLHGQRAPITLDSTPMDALDAAKQWLLSFSNGGRGVADRRDTSQFDKDFKARPGGSAAPPASARDPAALFDSLEKRYGLPKGLLDSLWDQESSRGDNLTSRTGVRGQFQITGANRKALGITDPDDLAQEAEGAARMMSDLLKRFRLPQALAAWNGGTAAAYDVDRAVNPAETRAFVPSVLHKIEQHNNITVHAADARGVKDAVTTALDDSNGNLLRDFTVKAR